MKRLIDRMLARLGLVRFSNYVEGQLYLRDYENEHGRISDRAWWNASRITHGRS